MAAAADHADGAAPAPKGEPEDARWFSPSRGLDTLAALRKALGAVAQGSDIRVEQAPAELGSLETVLSAVEAQQARFRFYLGS